MNPDRRPTSPAPERRPLRFSPGLLVPVAVPVLLLLFWMTSRKERLLLFWRSPEEYVVRTSATGEATAAVGAEAGPPPLDLVADPEDLDTLRILADPMPPPAREEPRLLRYQLETGSVHRWGLRCDVGGPGQKRIDQGSVDLSNVELHVHNAIARYGYGVYVVDFRIEPLVYKAWRLSPRHSRLGGIYGGRTMHPEEFGRLRAKEAFDAWLELRRKKARRSQLPLGIDELDRFTEAHHVVYLDLLLDFREARTLERVGRSLLAQERQKVELAMKKELYDDYSLYFEGGGKGPIDMTLLSSGFCVVVTEDRRTRPSTGTVR